jgi:hypothetical protein
LEIMARRIRKKAQDNDITALVDRVTTELLAELPDVVRALEELAAEKGTTFEDQLRRAKEVAIRNLTKATLQ